MVGNPILKAEPAKPAVGEVQRRLLTQPTLRSDAVALTRQEYPDHQLGIDRRLLRVAVQGRQLFVKPVQLQDAIDLSQPQQIDLLMTDVTRTLNARAKRHRLSVDRHAIHRMRRSHVAPRHLLSTPKQAHTRLEAGVFELSASLARWAQ